MNQNELKFFLSFCKKIREYQDAGYQDIKQEFHLIHIGQEFTAKQRYYLAYRLKEQGLVEIDHKKIMKLSDKGIDYIKQLRRERVK